MLFLTLPGDTVPHPSQLRIPVAELLALRLERALLCDDPAAREAELVRMLAEDPPFAGWAMRLAEIRLGRTINRIEDAARWLTGALERELGALLHMDGADNRSGEVEQRILALAAKLAHYERKCESFHMRLEQEKLDSLKELAYGASHEINNPLANIAARAQTLLADETDPERRRKLMAIHRQAMRAHEMIADLMLFARPPKLKIARCKLDELVRSAVEPFHHQAGEQNAELIYHSPPELLYLAADATQLGVALQAVIVNALEAIGDGGHVCVTAGKNFLDDEPWAQIAVSDDGPGFTDEVRRHMFDPFFSGREAGRGLGFGLSKCWRIVTEHGGRVAVQRLAPGGTEVALWLPLAS
jgi:signal transduction histidine kinase